MIPIAAIHAPAFAQVDLVRERSCIAACESGGRALLIGKHGERGLYQFKASTWRDTTDLPFHDAFDRAKASAAALKRLQWLSEQLEARGYLVTAYSLALAWKIGLDGQSTTVDLNYAQRVENLYNAR